MIGTAVSHYRILEAGHRIITAALEWPQPAPCVTVTADLTQASAAILLMFGPGVSDAK